MGAKFVTKIGLVDCKEPDCTNCPAYFYAIFLEDDTQIELSDTFKDRTDCERAAAIATEKVMKAFERYEAESMPEQEGFLH